MRRRRAAGEAVEDPILAAERKRRYYECKRDIIVARNRERRQRIKEQKFMEIAKKLVP